MKKLIKISTFFYLTFIIVLALIPFWPRSLWWLANIIQLMPLFLLGIPFIILLIATLALRLWKTALFQLLGIGVVVFGLMGFKFNISADRSALRRPGESLRILSMNIGRDREVGIRFNTSKFMDLVKQTSPDIIALQEAGSPSLLKEFTKAFPEETWYGSFQNGFSLISKMPVNVQDLDVSGLKGVLTEYRLITPAGPVTFFNVHFMTPRPGLEAIISKGSEGIEAMKKVTGIQARQAAMASETVKSNSNAIIAGDFNMTELFPLFRIYWSRFTDAFSQKGYGEGLTKYFLFHGVRIDHVLFGSDWKVVSARVGPSMDSDHRPVIVDLQFIGQPEAAPPSPKAEVAAEIPDYSNAYHYENFEVSPGSFDAGTTGEFFIDYENNTGRGNSLKIKMNSAAVPLKAGSAFNNWNIEQFGTLGFSYRIPERTPVCLRVKTSFDDWLCLGGVMESQCSGTKPAAFIRLIDDNQWHSVDIDVKSTVKAMLPALKYLDEFQFAIDRPTADNNFFWVDDFAIR